MKIIDSPGMPDGSVVATIGYFDGVHSGHRFLLRDLILNAFDTGRKSMVVTFSNHPALLFNPESDLRFLSTCDEKLARLQCEGIDYCLLLPFTHELASLRSDQFMDMLHNQYGVDRLLVGYDHHFGSDQKSDFADYCREGARIGVEVKRSEVFRVSDINVSSSKIRKALLEGNVELANELLGYDYRLSGRVVEGHKIGRTIGFPTANLSLPDLKLIPERGVYSAELTLDGVEYRAMINIGVRPTVNNGGMSVEVYIDGFRGDIYGRQIEVRLKKRLREEQKFASLDELRAQIERDLQAIRRKE